jgi:hypothetical protein
VPNFSFTPVDAHFSAMTATARLILAAMTAQRVALAVEIRHRSLRWLLCRRRGRRAAPPAGCREEHATRPLRNRGNQYPSFFGALLNSAVSAAFTLQDLRRTVASGMAGLGVQPHVIETCLNHKSGAGQSCCSTSGRVGELSANLAKKRY